LLTDAAGVPLSLVVGGANRHDSIFLEVVLENKVVQAPDGTTENLCLDAAYVGKEAVVEAAGYTPHIRPRGEEKKQKAADPTFKPRRWVVELSHSWFNRFRKLATRYEKTDRSYKGLLMLAAAMITLNKIIVIYG
jgi:putative transposase